ncbi:MAG: hypothetical protein CFE23_15315 [Flavobacterium sp. BFFFF1]|uniref:energy transducer TonB n=1 Tax=Flavobacterium sp. BFFFF1 TaxID=2015557 RepID=UPI000BC7F485|nr:energy transducer TonB [Flavobacterium sp. BFFFF1]OYU79163.1 MAG: hypothetical protein CFE23_15315 [Flavobacterium sp. BFFFF1]
MRLIIRSVFAVTERVVDSSLSEKKKSLILTAMLFAAMLLLLILLHMTSTKIEGLEGGGGGGGGEVAVNFGNSDLGSGENFTSKDLDLPASKPVVAETSNQEDIVTDESDNDVPAVVTVKKPKETPKKPETKPVDVPKKPSKDATDALSNLLNGSSKGGDGDDKSGGNKGKTNGSTSATGYAGGSGTTGGSGTGSGGGNGSGQGIGNGSGYGAGDGSGSGGGSGSGIGKGNGSWKLAGRKLRSSGKVVQKCNESGIVVVEVTVNRNGDVVGCKYIKGTTNTNPCLIQPAYETARSYKWYPKDDVNDKQIGTIVVNFSLN